AGPAPSPETGPTPACWPPVFDTCPTLVTRIDDQLPNSPRRTSIAPNSGASFKICTSRAMMSRFMSPRSARIVENLHEFQEVRPAVGQELGPLGRQVHVILDPPAALARPIEARLDRHPRPHMAVLSRVLDAP